MVVDHCSLSRIDGHMGIYNLTVKDSVLGKDSVELVGFGDLILENTTSYGSSYFLGFRSDYGCAWYGDVYINNCTWVCDTYSPTLIYALNFDPANDYYYEKSGDYYVEMARTINIDGFTLDVSSVDNPALYKQYLQIFSRTNNYKDFDKDFLMDKTKNVYPIKPPQEVNLKNFTVIKHPNFKTKTLEVVLKRNPENTVKDEYGNVRQELVCKDWYFYKDTKFNYDASTAKQITK